MKILILIFRRNIYKPNLTQSFIQINTIAKISSAIIFLYITLNGEYNKKNYETIIEGSTHLAKKWLLDSQF